MAHSIKPKFMYIVLVGGSGQLRNRNTEPLKVVNTPLYMVAIDSCQPLRDRERQRHEVLSSGARRSFTVCSEVREQLKRLVRRIIGANSQRRFEVHRAVAGQMLVSTAVINKKHFPHPRDYDQADLFASKYGVKLRIHSTMRQTNRYRGVLNVCRGHELVRHQVPVSRKGLMMQAIHYLDSMCHVLRREGFSASPNRLKRELVRRQAKGFSFVPRNATCSLHAGSFGPFTSKWTSGVICSYCVV